MLTLLTGLFSASEAGEVATLTGANVSDVSSTPTDAVAQYRLTNGGLEESKEGAAAWNTIDTWLLEGAAGDYEANYDPTGDTGSMSGNSIGSADPADWHALSSTVLWAITDTGAAGPPLSVTGTVSIRRASDSEVVATATLTLTAEEAV